MAINFPNNPAVNDTFTVGGTTFTFTGVKWESSAVVNVVMIRHHHWVVR